MPQGEVIDAEYESSNENGDDNVIEQTLSIPELMKSLLELRISGTLSSLAIKMKTTDGSTNEKEDDAPPDDSPPLWASIMPYVLDDTGNPVFGVFPKERHSANLYLHEKASLVIYSLTPPEYNPAKMPLPRINLSGDAKPLLESEVEGIQEKFKKVHPGATEYLNEYNYFKLEPSELVYFNQGNIEVVDVEDYNAAKADPVASGSRKTLSLFNKPKNTNLLGALCKEYAGVSIDEPVLYHMDRYGFNVIGKSKEDSGAYQEFRFPFPFEMKSTEEAAAAMDESISKIKE